MTTRRKVLWRLSAQQHIPTARAMVNTYASFFESLWNQSELYKKVKTHDRLQNEFISMAPHELRTPIQPILALSQHLYSQDSVLDAKERKEYLEIIVRNAIRLQQLTEGILDITKIERHSLQLKLEQIDFNEIVPKSIQDAKGSFDNNKVKINCHFSKMKLTLLGEIINALVKL